MSIDALVQNCFNVAAFVTKEEIDDLLYVVKSRSSGTVPLSCFAFKEEDILPLKVNHFVPFLLEINKDTSALAVIHVKARLARGRYKEVYRAVRCSISGETVKTQAAVAKIFPAEERKIYCEIIQGYWVQRQLARAGLPVATPLSGLVVGDRYGAYIEEYGGEAFDFDDEYNLPCRLEMMQQVLNFLIRLHREFGWVWGDLHPKNILVHWNQFNQIKLTFTDFDFLLQQFTFPVEKSISLGTEVECQWYSASRRQWFLIQFGKEEPAEQAWALPDTDIVAFIFCFNHSLGDVQGPFSSSLVQRVTEFRATLALEEDETASALIERRLVAFFRAVLDNSEWRWFTPDYRYHTARQILAAVQKCRLFLDLNRISAQTPAIGDLYIPPEGKWNSPVPPVDFKKR